MLICKHCQSDNGLDARFCKGCGLGLPDDDIRIALAKHESMITEGYGLFNAGRTEEATLMAHAAVEANPASARAMSLLAMCYERSGQIAEALESYERALQLSPDSPLDRIKVTQLRNMLAGRLQQPPPNKKVAFVGATAAVVLVIVLGAIVASMGTRQAVAQTGTPSAGNTGVEDLKPFTGSNAPSQLGTMQSSNGVPGAISPAPLNAYDRANQAVLHPTQPPVRFPTSTGEPDISGSIPPVNPVDLGKVAIQPTPPTATNQALQDAGNAAQGKDPDPKADQPQAQPPAKPEEPKEDPGIVEIRVSRPSQQSSSSGGSDSSSANGLQALMKAARQEYMLGRYGASAKAYERALSAGGDSGFINQRLGMCYEKLGKNSDAVNAYSRAASSFQQAIDSGRGDSKRLKSALDSSKQAMKLLKG